MDSTNTDGSKTVRVVAAILDTTQLTLYREDGTTIVIRQGDPRVQTILDEVTEPLTRQGWADATLSKGDPQATAYRDFEEKSGGVVRLFRVAKRWLKDVFVGESSGGYLQPVSLGSVPVQDNILETNTDQIVSKTKAPERPSVAQATAEIMANAQPVTDPGFHTDDTTSDDTMIARVEHPETGEITVIPGVENLEHQFRNAAKLGSTVGVENFLRRLAAVIAERGHTVDELLRFMSRGDLPIADDGSIVAYKVLKTLANDPKKCGKGVFFDCHTGNVPQRVGSLVRQKTVDPSRRTQCSTGLHIARRGYLGGFSGDVITLVKVAPEDVVAVPLGEPDKMRAAAYHVLFEVPRDQHGLLRSNKAIDSDAAKLLLGRALRGDHIGVTEIVEIGGSAGTNVTVTLVDQVINQSQQSDNAEPAEPIDTAPSKAQAAPGVDPKAVSRRSLHAKMTNEEVDAQEDLVSKIAEAVEQVPEVDDLVGITKPAPAPEPQTESRLQKGTRLIRVVQSNQGLPHRQAAARELVALKKSSKVGWDKLGVKAEEVTVVQQLATEPVTEPENKPENKPESTKKGKPSKTPASAPAGNETRGQKAMRLYLASDWAGLWAHKRSVKVGWSALGFSQGEENVILANKK